jgi:hypothetical protein
MAVPLCRQSEEMRFLFLVQVNRPVFGFAMNTRIGDFSEPLCGHLVEMF